MRGGRTYVGHFDGCKMVVVVMGKSEAWFNWLVGCRRRFTHFSLSRVTAVPRALNLGFVERVIVNVNA